MQEYDYPTLEQAAPSFARVGHLILRPSAFDAEADTKAIFTATGYLLSVSVGEPAEVEATSSEPIDAERLAASCQSYVDQAAGKPVAQRIGDGKLLKVIGGLAGKVLTSEQFQALLAKLIAGALA